MPGPDHVPNTRRPRATGGSFFLFFSVAGACVYAATQTHRSALAVFVRRQLADIPTAHAPHQTSRVAATISDSGVASKGESIATLAAGWIGFAVRVIDQP